MVAYRCKKYGQSHPAPVGWDSEERFDAVPEQRTVGHWGCPQDGPKDRPLPYRKADLAWEENPRG